MNCQECEIRLGMGLDAAEHLASCAECRGLARELRLNASALGEMRVRTEVRWQWALAAAAIVMAVGLWRTAPAKKPATVKIAETRRQENQAPRVSPVMRAKGHSTMRATAQVKKRKALEPLRMKMFTSDPDVVIYWIVDRKEGSE